MRTNRKYCITRAYRSQIISFHCIIDMCAFTEIRDCILDINAEWLRARIVHISLKVHFIFSVMHSCISSHCIITIFFIECEIDYRSKDANASIAQVDSQRCEFRLFLQCSARARPHDRVSRCTTDPGNSYKVASNCAFVTNCKKGAVRRKIFAQKKTRIDLVATLTRRRCERRCKTK